MPQPKIVKTFNEVKTQRLVNAYDKQIVDSLEETFDNKKQEIIDIILIDYDIELEVSDRRSKTAPHLYRDDFIDRLQEFEYTEVNRLTVNLIIPDMENFDFKGRLRVVETILEGTAGAHVEINAEDYEKIYNRRPINLEPLDKSLPKRDLFYIIRYTSDVQRRERDILKKKLVPYPFSNTPPIDIFSTADKYVDDNLDDWIDEAVDKATDKFTARGVA